MIGSFARARRARKNVSTALAFLFVLAFVPPPPAARVAAQSAGDAQLLAVPTIPAGNAYRLTTLISDIPGQAPVLDPLLVNPWGLTTRNTSPFWVSNNGSGTTQLITGDVGGAPVRLNASPQTITIPGGLPTGVVGNTSTTDFLITPPGGGTPAPANFIFDSLVGNILAWNGASGSAAQIVPGAARPGHAWTGLALANNGSANFIYAANFNAPIPSPTPTPTATPTPSPTPLPVQIDVFDGTFTQQPAASFPFFDPTIPVGYAAFNIQNLGANQLYVTYAKVGTGGHVQNGPGLGFVRKYDANGARIATFGIDGGALDAPWGLAIAPATFGAFAGKLLVGNFAPNGQIHAYDPTTGAAFVPTGLPDNTLRNEAGQPIEISGLWALLFGNGGNGGDVNTLYFTAGPPGSPSEEHGIFGKLNPTTAQATSLIQFATPTFSIDEAGGHVDFTVIRTGDASGTATVNFNTSDFSVAGHASQKSDYEIALGSFTFNPGDTVKNIRVLIVNDNFVEGDETIDLSLTNPTGAGVGLGSPNTAKITILDNDAAPSASNPIDNSSFFVRQHYLDFLNREPDAPGQAFWTNEIESCGGDAQCREIKRINVSAAFFLSIEFQRTGLLAYATHRAAFGPSVPGTPVPVLYGNFMRDVQTLQRNLVFGQSDFDATLEANKVAYFNEFVTRPEFVAKYSSALSNADYVDNLLASAGMSPNDFTINLTNSQEVPPTNPTTTGGGFRPASYGTARFVFNPALTSLTFNATINNIDVTGSQTPDTNDNITNAHIHAGPSVAPGVNGPVVWGFFGTPFNDNNPPDQSVVPFATPDLGIFGGNFSGKWDPPEGNGTTLAAQLDNLRAGRAYINFHTNQFSGGEIRGNFPELVTFRDSLVAGLNNSTETRATVLRKIAESNFLQARELNSAFVTMEYFGYLRRDPDAAGFAFWANKLNSFSGNFIRAEMVKAFISSSEYRQRFGAS